MRARLLGTWAILAVAAYGCGGGSGSPPSDAHDASLTDAGADRGQDLGKDAAADAGADRADVVSDASSDGAGDTRDAADARDGASADAAPDVAAPTCSDNIKNSDETDVDCGGHCGKCGPTKRCLVGADCTFGVCKSDHTCGECNLASDCPGTETECVHRACTAGSCGMSSDPAGTVLTQQTVGDCQSRQCASDGTVKNVADDTDVPDDRNPCTSDTCTNGAPVHTMLPVNSSCGGQNRCSASGQCVGCLTGTDCPGSDTACQTRTCSAQGVCGFSFKASGTPLTDPTAGDCKGEQCDGAGNSVPFNNSGDLPVDGNPCTTDECSAGTPVHHPVASGTGCGTGLVCDGANHCVACLTASTCPGSDTECQTRTCIDGACGVSNTPGGTVTVAQVPRDCQLAECNGNGGTFTVPDPTDVPVDGNPCTADVCSGKTPSNPAVAAGTSCGTNLMCNGAGQCVGCITVADCPGTDAPCQMRACTSGQCVVNNVTQGTLVGTQVAGDCQRTQCGSAGNIETVPDPSDLPNDGNACTADTCTGGNPTFTPVMVGTPCSDQGGAVCNAVGACVSCNVASDCPGGPDTECHLRVCSAAGTCSVSLPGNEKVVSSQTLHDCQQNVCDGQGNVTSIADNADLPLDGNQCTQDLCTNGMPSNPIAAGANCSQNGGALCDASGACVQCLGDTDCDNTHDTPCNKNRCVSGACAFVAEPLNTAVADTTIGDCHGSVCDGMGAVVPMVDDNDVPVDGKTCTQDVCTGGVATNPAVTVGTACSQNGGAHCDATGSCVPSFMVARIGDGTSTTLTSAGTPIFVEERLASDGALLRVINVPSGAGPPNPLTISGTADSEGALALSGDKHAVAIAGYSAVAGTAGVASSASTAIQRGAALVFANGAVDTSTTFGTTTFSGNNARGAVSNDGTQIWSTGNGSGAMRGVFFSALGATTSTLIESATNSGRVCEIAGGQLYCDAANGSQGIFAVGTGLPTGTATATPLSGTVDADASYYAFAMLDLSGDGVVDTMYVADDRAAAPGGIEKWTLSSGTWSKIWDTNTSAGTTGVRGLTGYVVGSSAVVLATTASASPAPNAIIRLVDSGTTPTAAGISTLVPASSGVTVFRGIALAPQ